MSIGGIFNGLRYTDTSMQKSADAVTKDITGTELKPGMQLTGKVVSVNNGDAVIDVNGKTINAKLDGNVSLANGENVTFDVKGTGNNQIVLTPLYTNTANTSTAIKALSYAGLPVNDVTVSMADSMIRNNMNIDAKSLSGMYRQVNSFSDISPETIISMRKMGIEINSDNIESFQAFKNYEKQVGTGINDILDSVKDAFKELVNRQDDAGFKSFALDMIKVALGDTKSAAEGVITDNAEVINTANEDAEVLNVNQAKIAENDEAVLTGNNEKIVLSENNTADGKIIDLTDNLGKEVINPEKVVVKESFINELSFNEKKDVNNADNEINSQSKEIVSDKLVDINTDKAENDTFKNMTPAERSEIVNALKDAGYDTLEVNKLYDSQASSKDVLKLTQEALIKGNITDKLKKMISSDKFGDILKDSVKNDLFLKPQDVAEKDTVQNLYKKLYDQVKNITESISSNALADSALSSKLSDMNSNLDFMNQMNNVYQYVQLPLKLAGSEATGDLYVYTDKKSLASKDGNVSALLHLDMDHLGPLDVYASITPGNNVYTKFTLSDESVLSFIESNMHILNERLSNRGYNMKYDAVTINEDSTVNETIKKEAVNTMKYSFDMKA